MRSLAPYIRKVDHECFRQFSLNPETPLLSVGPNRLGRNGGHVQRKDGAGRGRRPSRSRCTSAVGWIKRGPIPDFTDAWVAEGKRLWHAMHDRPPGLQGARIGFVSAPLLNK